MVYTISGIRFPVVPSVYKSSQPSFHGDRRSTTLSFVHKKDSFSQKTLAGKFSYDSDSSSCIIAETDKVLIPRDQDNSSSLTDQLESPHTTSDDPQWIDFPRGDQHLPNGTIIPGNKNSFDKCRRRFDLVTTFWH